MPVPPAPVINPLLTPDSPRPQELDLMFFAPPTGRYDLTLHIMSSTWIGADLAVPVKFKVATLTR